MVDFNAEVFYDLPFTSDLKKMEESLNQIDARGGKALRDAIGQSIDHVERAGRNKKKVLVVVTERNDSRHLTQTYCWARSETAACRSTPSAY